MRRTELLQEVRKMRFEEACWEWQSCPAYVTAVRTNMITQEAQAGADFDGLFHIFPSN